MTRTAVLRRRLIHLGNDGSAPSAASLGSRRNSAAEAKRRHSNAAPLRTITTLSDQPIPEDQPAILARPCSAPSAMAMQQLLTPGLQQQYRASRRSWQHPGALPEGSMAAGLQGSLMPGGFVHQKPPVAPPNPFAAAANPFATAPPRAGGQPWGGPAAPRPSPFAGHAAAYPPETAAAAQPFGCLPPAPSQPPVMRGSPNPFAAVSARTCDWDFMEEPATYEGDGFDSDTTDFVSRNASRAPFARGGGLSLFATDDQVQLLYCFVLALVSSLLYLRNFFSFYRTCILAGVRH